MGESAAGTHYLQDTDRQLRKYKAMAEAAFAQVTDADFFRTPDGDPESNSVALVVKHVSGNMLSRWRDFRSTDGEKPERRRDAEFEVEPADSRSSIVARWEEGWAVLFDALSPLQERDLLETVRIRDEAHTVLEAIQRQLTHYVYHIGQIVFLAKHLAGARWRPLSIPKGKSRDFDVAKNGRPYSLR